MTGTEVVTGQQRDRNLDGVRQVEDEGRAKLPWEAMRAAQEEVPWAALESFADALVADPSLFASLAEAYAGAAEVSYTEHRYEDLCVAGICALAGPRLDSRCRLELSRLLVAWLWNAGVSGDWDLADALTAACGSLGPDALPAVLDEILRTLPAVRLDEDGDVMAWYGLLNLTQLVCQADDEAVRERVAQTCTSLLHEAAGDEIEMDLAAEVAWTLAYMGHTESLPLLQEMAARSAGTLDAAEYREAYRLLKGNARRHLPRQAWEYPVREWLDEAWANRQERYAEDAWEEEMEERARRRREQQEKSEKDEGEPAETVVRAAPKVGRNAPCPCASGKKYKKCCGRPAPTR